MTGERSTDPAHKLHAAMVSAHPAPDRHFPDGYIERCREWYESLSRGDRMVAASAVDELNAGKQDKALEIAAGLPAALRFE